MSEHCPKNSFFPGNILLAISRLLVFLVSFSIPVLSAELDDLYIPLVEPGQLLYTFEGSYFQRKQDGSSGSTTYDAIEGVSRFYSIANSIAVTPLPFFEIRLRQSYTPPTDYRRILSRETGPGAGAIYTFDLKYFQDYYCNLRLRAEPFEFYLDFNEKYQKSNWTFSQPPEAVSFWTYLNAHYEDVRAGMRYVSDSVAASATSNLSLMKRPLLDDKQLNVEFELGYKQGQLHSNSNQLYSGFWYYYNFHHELMGHFIPQLTLRYGINENTELETKLTVITPYKYKYRYKQFFSDGTSIFMPGTYRLERNISIPLQVRWRPADSTEVAIGWQYKTTYLRLDYWDKDRANVITNYPSKKLTYHNLKPAISFTYLYDADKEIDNDTLSRATKRLLRKNQWLCETSYEHDLTFLKKNDVTGPQNIIDPYNVFLYPLDYFVVGTEYATAFVGNFSRYATNVLPQNFYKFSTAFFYGLNDACTLGLRGGYRSRSDLHYFSLRDRRTRYYTFRPYYFIDLLADYRITQNTILSFNSHFVPFYKLYLDYEEDPQQYESKACYFQTSLAVSVLF